MPNSAIVGALAAVLGLDATSYDAGWKKAPRTARTGMSGVQGAVQGATKHVNDNLRGMASQAGVAGAAITGMGGPALLAAAALAGLAAAMRQARAAAAFGDEIADSAAKIAVSTNTLQEYRYAVHQLGGEFTDADAALGAFSKAFGLAQSRFSKRATKPFEALGLDASQFANADQALKAVIQRISALESTAQQAAIAEKLGLSPMLTALRAGADRIDELRRAAHDLGFVMDADLVEKASDANDKFEVLAQVIDVQFKSAFVELAPEILKVTEAIADLVTWMAKLAHSPKFKGAVGATIQAGADSISPVLGGIVAGVRARPAKRGPAKSHAPGRATVADSDGASLLPVGLGSGSKGRSASQIAQSSEAAIAAAARDELAARIALTGGIEAVAELRLREVADATAEANSRLLSDAAEGKITKAAAAKAIALNDEAAKEKARAITRDAQTEADNHTLAQSEEINRFYDQIAAIQASLAGTATARAAIEAKSLAAQQALETRKLETETAQQVAAGEFTESYRRAKLASLADLQAAQRLAQERQASAEIQGEANDQAEAALQLQIDILASQADAAETDGQRRDIQLSILKLEQQLERLKLQEVLASVTASAAEKEIARRRLAALGEIQGNQTKAAIGGLLETFDRTKSALEGMADAFKNHDWKGAIEGLSSTISQLKQAFGSNGTFGGKVGAVAGVADMAGQAIGGPAGSALSGAASGALAGTMILPGIGTAIGAILGGIAGFLSGSKAKKAQQAADAKAAAEKAAQDAADAAARALQVANEKRQIEIQILSAQGDAVGALAKQREAELASLDDSNRALQQQLYDLNDAAEKAAQAAGVAAEAHRLQIEVMDALGDASGVLAAKRADELAALDFSNRGLQQEIYNLQDLAAARDEATKAQADAEEAAAGRVTEAQGRLNDARNRDAAQLTETAQKYQAYADNLRSYADSIGSSAAGPSGFAGVSAEFARVSSQARLGDEAALGALQGISETYRTGAHAQAKTAVDAQRVDAQVRAAVQAAADTAGRTASIAQQELEALNQEVDALLGVKAGVDTVSEDIKALLAATLAQAAAGPAAYAAALDAAVARIAPPTLAAFNPGPSSALSATSSAAVDPSAFAGGPTAAEIALAIAAELNPALVVIASNTGVAADVLEDVSLGEQTFNTVTV